MKIWIILCVFFVSASCAPMVDNQLSNGWALFKHVLGKQYKSLEEELARYVLIPASLTPWTSTSLIHFLFAQSNYLGK
jgi:hypothetical protein